MRRGPLYMILASLLLTVMIAAVRPSGWALAGGALVVSAGMVLVLQRQAPKLVDET